MWPSCLLLLLVIPMCFRLFVCLFVCFSDRPAPIVPNTAPKSLRPRKVQYNNSAALSWKSDLSFAHSTNLTKSITWYTLPVNSVLSQQYTDHNHQIQLLHMFWLPTHSSCCSLLSSPMYLYHYTVAQSVFPSFSSCLQHEVEFGIIHKILK